MKKDCCEEPTKEKSRTFRIPLAGLLIGAFTILTLIQSFILIDQWLSHRALHKHLFHLLSPVFILAFLFPFLTQFAIVTHPTLAAWFKIVPVSPPMFGVLILISALSFGGIKGVKMILR